MTIIKQKITGAGRIQEKIGTFNKVQWDTHGMVTEKIVQQFSK